MRKFVFFLVILLLFVAFTYAQDKTRVRVDLIKPRPDMVMEFEKGLAAHIQKFHSRATDPVDVFVTISGKNTGTYHFVQGPLSWADIAGKQYSGDHADDWNKNVSKYVLSEELHYYNYMPNYSYSQNPDDPATEYAILNAITVKPGGIGAFLHSLEVRKEAYSKAKDARHYNWYSHSFSGSNDEPDFVAVSYLKGGLADLDKDNTNTYKLLTDNISPYAPLNDQWYYLNTIEKIETSLVHHEANLSSK